MANLLLTAIGTTGIVSGVGSQIIGQSISLTASGITASVKYFFSSKKSNIKEVKDIKKVLKELDIEADIQIIKSYMDSHMVNDPVILKGWSNLNETMKEILSETENINKKIKFVEESTKIGIWWNGYPDFTQHCEEIYRLIAKFNRRFDILVKIIK